ncbi:MAG: glycosyltransferase family 4 protein [Desulfobacterota bacterium]|nr:glycosyltransferase family 4 protein [Thermodesulfobacteriota bacterium]
MLGGILSNRSRLLGIFRTRPKLEYVIDATTWSPYWDAFYLVRELRNRFGLDAKISRDPQAARNTIVHFGDRYVYVDVFQHVMHPSNTLFLTWFHGDPTDSENGFDILFAKLKESLDRIKKIVVPCRITLNALATAGVPQEQLVLIPLGVDLSLFRPLAHNRKQRLRSMLGIPEHAFCIGSFQKDGLGWDEGDKPKLIKGPDILLESIATLHRMYPDIFVMLTGPARGYVKKGLTKIGVPFVHHTVKRYQDMSLYYGATDLCLITSRCEGGPKALLEAWACKVPVVATCVGMVADCVEHGRTGMVAPVESVKALVESIRELREHPSLCTTIITSAYKQVRDFDWKNIAKTYYTRLYQCPST